MTKTQDAHRGRWVNEQKQALKLTLQNKTLSDEKNFMMLKLPCSLVQHHRGILLHPSFAADTNCGNQCSKASGLSKSCKS